MADCCPNCCANSNPNGDIAKHKLAHRRTDSNSYRHSSSHIESLSVNPSKVRQPKDDVDALRQRRA